MKRRRLDGKDWLNISSVDVANMLEGPKRTTVHKSASATSSRRFDTPLTLFYDAKTGPEASNFGVWRRQTHAGRSLQRQARQPANEAMLSIPHLIIIFVVALVVFGPEKLPELARTLGKVMAEFRRATGDLRSTFEDHLRDLEREAEGRRIGGGSTSQPPRETDVPSLGTVPTSAANSAERAGPATYASANPGPPVPAKEPRNSETDPNANDSGTLTDGHSPA